MLQTCCKTMQNHDLGFGGVDSHFCRFTLGHKSLQCKLEVTTWWRQHNHIIRKMLPWNTKTYLATSKWCVQKTEQNLWQVCVQRRSSAIWMNPIFCQQCKPSSRCGCTGSEWLITTHQIPHTSHLPTTSVLSGGQQYPTPIVSNVSRAPLTPPESSDQKSHFMVTSNPSHTFFASATARAAVHCCYLSAASRVP